MKRPKQKKPPTRPWVDAGAKERILAPGEAAAIRRWLAETDDEIWRLSSAEREAR
jgi:hypothetical protein